VVGGIFQLLCRLRELVLRELGFRDIFKKVKVSLTVIWDAICYCYATMDNKRWKKSVI